MNNKLLEKTQKEVEEVLDQMDICTDKTSDKYGILLQTYRDLMSAMDDEQKRINSISELERKEDELAFNERRAEREAEIEEKKLRAEKQSHIMDIVKKIISGGVLVGANVLTIIFCVKMNNSGETLTSFQNKFIFPEKFK